MKSSLIQITGEDMGFRIPQNSLNQLSPGVRSIFEASPEFQGRQGGPLAQSGIGGAVQREGERSGLSSQTLLAQGRLQQQAQSGASSTLGKLAASGGMRSGARERVGVDTQQQVLQGSADLASQDESRRLQAANQFAGIQLGAEDIDAKERQGLNIFNQQQSAQAQAALAAEQQAQAQDKLAAEEKKGKLGRAIGGVVGGVAGGVFGGGPLGAGAGASVDSSLGGMF